MGKAVARRIQDSILSGMERRLLDRLCAAAPPCITPDRLTLLGFAGAALAGAGFALSPHAPGFLLLAAAGLMLNWLGDSLDGSLARWRAIQRPRYGYFLDHSVDALNNLMIMAGLGFTAAVRLPIALAALTGYFLLCLHAFLRRQVLDELKIAFVLLGPTELRLVLIAMALGIYAGWMPMIGPVTVYEALLLFAAACFLLVFLGASVAVARRLAREDR